MNIVERGVVGFCRVVLWLSTVAIFVILVANTVLRYARGSSLQWANEVPELLFPWLVMAGVVLAAVHGAHIATTFLMEAVPAAVQRTVAALGWLVVAALYGTLAVATFRMLDVVHADLRLRHGRHGAARLAGLAVRLAGLARAARDGIGRRRPCADGALVGPRRRP
jgi:TRAP-type C4-dicarboxylate transport system permease small subunit